MYELHLQNIPHIVVTDDVSHAPMSCERCAVFGPALDDQHSSTRVEARHCRTCESERQKLVETLRRTGRKHLVVFRFNQDEYHDAHGVRVPSCWGYDKATGKVRIVEKQRTQLDARFDKLFQVMAMYLEEGCRPPADEPVFVIELFYDTYDAGGARWVGGVGTADKVQ